MVVLVAGVLFLEQKLNSARGCGFMGSTGASLLLSHRKRASASMRLSTRTRSSRLPTDESGTALPPFERVSRRADCHASGPVSSRTAR